MAHDHDPHRYDRAFAIGVALNLGFVVIEFVYGMLGDSLALVADAGHNLSDVASLLLAWGAASVAGRHPSRSFTYGLRKASVLASLLSALLLLLALGAIGWEAIRRFGEPVAPSATTVLVVAGIGVVINVATAWLFMADREHDLNIEGAFLHMAADAAVSLGVVVSGALILWTGASWIDPAVSLALVAVILIGTWRLLRESVRLSLDAAPRDIDLDAIERWLRERPGITDLHDLHVWALSTTRNALTVHVVADGPGPPPDPLELSASLTERFGLDHNTIQVEGPRADCPARCDAT